MGELMATPGALAAASSASVGTSAEVAAGAAATAVPMQAVLPGTLSPAVIAGTARVVAHGADKLAMSTLGSMIVAQVAEAYGENGAAYEITDDGGATALMV